MLLCSGTVPHPPIPLSFILFIDPVHSIVSVYSYYADLSQITDGKRFFYKHLNLKFGQKQKLTKWTVNFFCKHHNPFIFKVTIFGQ